MLGKSCIPSKLSTVKFTAYNSLSVRERKKKKNNETEDKIEYDTILLLYNAAINKFKAI
jgi:hypothetical protein